MAIQKRLVVPLTSEQQPNKRRDKPGHEELMIFVFGIVILLLGFAALFVLHLRTALPATVDEASSLQSGSAPGTDSALQWLEWKLNLSRAQENQIRPVVAKEIRERAALLRIPAVSTSEQKAQLVELRNQALEEIRPVLTRRQRSVLHDLEQEGKS
jgi:Spy/CpxP family protein refolding chaperone